MIAMITKMSLIVLGHVAITLLLWYLLREKKTTTIVKLLIGVVYGLCAVLSTHFGVEYSHMILNVRDLGPLVAGLFFDPLSGILAGLIGGIERYIVGTYFGIGSYTRIACSVSTCLSGFLAAGLHLFIFKKKKPSHTYAFFMGAVMEVFHMYVVFITHRNDMKMAFYVVKTCSIPMIIFTGLGLAIVSFILRILSGEKLNLFKKLREDEIKVSQRFQFWLFVVSGSLIIFSFLFAFAIQTQTAIQNARSEMLHMAEDIRETYSRILEYGEDTDILHFHVGEEGSFDIIQSDGVIVAGDHDGSRMDTKDYENVTSIKDASFGRGTFFGIDSFYYVETLSDTDTLLIRHPVTEVYEDRDAGAYETGFAYILLFAVIYVLISMLVNAIVVDNLDMVNASLNKITN